MNKKLGLLAFLLAFLICIVSQNEAAAAGTYSGGLLDKVPLKTGPTFMQPTGADVTAITDGDASTRHYMQYPLVWHKFEKEQTIGAVIVNGKGAFVEFYGSNNNLLDTYTPVTNDGVESLPKPVEHVSTIVLKRPDGNVFEWNVFNTAIYKAEPTMITWIQAGDKSVDLDWKATGAESYNVRRSTSPGGPYALIANVKGTSYADESVVNGTTYYYVVTSVNAAGESLPSLERSIKPEATIYTGGLLDRKVLNLGKIFGSSTGTSRIMTDNDVYSMQLVSGMAWYSFETPVNIESTIVYGAPGSTIEFYDADKKLITSYMPALNNQIENLPSPVKNVTSVVLKHTEGNFREWNVFGKSVEPPVAAPLNLKATGGDKKVTLTWNSVNNATSYNVKRSTTAGGPYVTVGSVTGSTYTYTDTNVVNGTTYYYVVTAVAAAGESAPSNEASATPKAGDVVVPPVEESGDSAILVITLNNGTAKEYDLSMNEVNAFIAWYEGRAAGKGPVMFAIDKHENNKGPFKNRKDYILYDKIITFEVNAYDNGKGGNGETTPPANPEDPSNY
ncbi:hypothetical protein P4H65_04380 [Paenibacillus chitinolyticus]|uniref:hypothetical protein n=1 Tax=Paenibacillus chitinolyticus TaxID=79263 RepID=UPI002DBF4B7D|nr:hypothetical protein [Paenibacillus chitinolyticus]MEC0245026.1 hypothetical protein [Paenibacillus chitinolyticus]